MTENSAALLPQAIGLQESAPIVARTKGSGAASDPSIVVNDLPITSSPPLALAQDTRARGPARNIRFTLHSDLRNIESEWKRFEQNADCSVFQRHVWLCKFQQHIGSQRGTKPAVVFGRDDCSKLLFILPLAVEMRGVRHVVRFQVPATCRSLPTKSPMRAAPPAWNASPA